MIISLNWLKEFVTIDQSPDELAQTIGSRLVEVERVVDLGERYNGAVVVKIARTQPHPTADALKLAYIDDGGVISDVPRSDDGYVQVVCGAPNAEANLLTVWLPPGVVLPATYGDGKPTVLEARDIRGQTSYGMLASPAELAISSDHSGIVTIDKPAAAGDSFAKLYGLDDYLFDIENKSLTHRPDCFGVIGFAREVAAITGSEFTTPKWLTILEPEFSAALKSETSVPDVTIADALIAPRYQAIVLSDLKKLPHSPLQIQSYLSRVGLRPINAVVDTTNYLMLLTGQPLHAYDCDKFVALHPEKKAEIVVREARAGESLTLLDGRVVALHERDIVICSGEVPVALAGVMGGALAEVSAGTKNILLESANFDLYRIRATSMRHGIFSEAVTRFTKGQPAEQTAPVLASAARIICQVTDARLSDIAGAGQALSKRQPIKLNVDTVSALLGTKLSASDIKTSLCAAEFIVEASHQHLLVTPPYWRVDVYIAEDLIEEIGRIRGFDTITPTMPTRPMEATRPSSFDRFRYSLTQKLASYGANEVQTYSFVHKQLIDRATQDAGQAHALTNAISPDLHYYRLSITPNLLAHVHANIKQGHDDFALFETGKVHMRGVMDQAETDVPAEFARMSCVRASSSSSEAVHGAPYFWAKQLLGVVAPLAQLTFTPLTTAESVYESMSAPYEPKRSALIMAGPRVLGVIGEFKKSVTSSFKLPAFCGGYELDLDALAGIFGQSSQSYQRQSRFPSTSKDICAQVSSPTSYADVERIIRSQLSSQPLLWQLEPVDIYQPEAANTKNITLRITLTNTERTITSPEANQVVDGVGTALAAELEAIII